MNKHCRDIILVIKDEALRPEAIATKVDHLNDILAYVDNKEGFCKAHELVTRCCITSNKNKIISAAEHERLKPFCFLINKN